MEQNKVNQWLSEDSDRTINHIVNLMSEFLEQTPEITINLSDPSVLRSVELTGTQHQYILETLETFLTEKIEED